MWRKCRIILVSLILILHIALSIESATVWSPTHDEHWHLPVGLLNFQTSEFHHEVLNPPLIRLWAALPLYTFMNRQLDVLPGIDPARHGDAFVNAYGKEVQYAYLSGRIMNIMLSVLTGILLYLNVSNQAGDVAGILVLLLWCTNPNIIAHSSVVTTDLGAALAFYLTFISTVHMHQRKSLYSAILLGMILGIAQCVKFTCLILIPLSILSFNAWGRLNDSPKPTNIIPDNTGVLSQCSILQKYCFCGYKMWIAVIAIMIMTINISYLGEGCASPLRDLNISSKKIKTLIGFIPGINSVPIPLPAPYVQGIDQQLKIMEGQHPVFFLEWYDHGFFTFYLLNLLLKNPLIYVPLILWGGYSLVAHSRQASWGFIQLSTGLFWGLTLFLVASFSSMQLGIRYILPIFPFILMSIGHSFKHYNEWQRGVKYIATLLIVFGAIYPLHNRPHHLSYTNLLAGNTWEGYNYVGDSNYDWGQDLFSFKKFYDQEKLNDINMAYFGTFPVERLGIVYHLPPNLAPKPGWYAVSANLLTGRQYPLRKPDGSRDSGIQDRYFYLRYFTPKHRIGTSIFVYYLTEEDVARWQHDMQQLYQQVAP